MTFSLNQSTRAILLFVDIALLVLFSWLAFGNWMPPLGEKGFWFYTALVILILGNRLVTPFYNKPVDAITYSVTAIIALFLINNWSQWVGGEKLFFTLTIGFAGFVLAASFLQIFIKDSSRQAQQLFSNNLRITVDVLGSPRIIFSLVIWFAIYTFHRSSASEMLWIGAAWAVTVAFSPVEELLLLGKRLRFQWRPGHLPVVMGEVVAFQNPSILLIRQLRGTDISFGTPLLINDAHSQAFVAIALDFVGRDEGRLRRAVEVSAAIPVVGIKERIVSLPDNVAAKIELGDIEYGDKRSRTIMSEIDSLVGLVASETSIERLYFEAIKEEELEEGRLVETFIGGKPVLYQIVNGLTKEELVHQKNTHGYARAQAQKIGVWNEEDKKFALVKWLPLLNSPVFIKKKESVLVDPDAVGHFPETTFPAYFKSIPELVTHNTAILGILGIGKSYLAFEIVERVLSQNIKVICLDLTDEYADELKEFCYDYSGDELYKKLIENTGPKGKTTVSRHVEEGGNKPAFASVLDDYIERFVHDKKGPNLLVFNPSQYEVWRQDSKPYSGEASMASLSPTEITQLFTEAALKACQKLGKVDKGQSRVCVVYEEAHSLIPEWNTVVYEGDKAAVNGTSRAILQGRKFGLGCILISQRTANVTKTILNQCNTIFAMRTFDDTGKEFLSNYIGRDYAAVLPSLQERHAVFFGKASKCENPILIRLNDRDKFLAVFRDKYKKPNASLVKPVDETESENPQKLDD